LADPLFQDAVLHSFLILGEAAAQVSQPMRDRLPELPWHDIVGIRNHIVHGDARIDLRILWKTIQEDIPPLVESLLAVIPPEVT